MKMVCDVSNPPLCLETIDAFHATTFKNIIRGISVFVTETPFLS